jgi:hypothetical protein
MDGWVIIFDSSFGERPLLWFSRAMKSGLYFYISPENQNKPVAREGFSLLEPEPRRDSTGENRPMTWSNHRRQ